MKRLTAIVIILLFFMSLTYASRSLPWIELTFSPAKATESAQKYRLLPTTEEQIDADAVPLYQKAIKIETDNLKNYNLLLREQFEKQLKPAHDKVLQQMNHIDRKIAALQCIEGLRLYAGSHDGKFPEKLADVTDIKIPVDPVTKKPFSYKSTGPEAVLELEGTEGSESRDAVRYELKLK
jgi:hypothetical protein